MSAFLGALCAVVLVAFAPVPASATLLGHLWGVVDSNIAIAIVSTFVAAFAGTWGAQRLAERSARRKALLDEVRGTNAAIGLAFNIANTYIVTKKQHVRDQVTQYEVQLAARNMHQQGIETGTIPPGTAFAYQLELRTIAPPFSPIEELQALLRDKVSPEGKAIILLTPLVQSIRGFADTVAQRNEWIAEFKRLPGDADAYRAALYFGTPFAQGRTDERYPNFMKALGMQTDDCIAFSMLIAQSLEKHGGRLATQYGNGTPKIASPHFELAGGLLPDMTHYADWLKN